MSGLSTQDVSALYGDAFGANRFSKSTVSRVTQQLNQEFDTCRRRDWNDLPVLHLFLDGQHHAARQGTNEKEGVLSAYALLEDGQPVLVRLDLGPRESSDAWLSFLQELTARGLKAPLLIVMGRPGLVKAIKRVWLHACRQRCQVHKMRNILSKLQRMMQPKMKALVHQVFRAPSYPVALKRGCDLIARFKDRHTAAI
jgi:putative transposase